MRLPLEVFARGPRSASAARRRRLPLSRRRRASRAATTSTMPRGSASSSRRPAWTFLSISQGGKFEDAKQPEGRLGGVPVHRAERLRVHADDLSPTRAARSRATCRSPRRSARPCARRASRHPIVTAGGICEFEQAERCSSAARPTSSRPRARRSPTPTGSLKIADRSRRRDPALRVHELLRGARPAAQAGDLQALGSRGARSRPTSRSRADGKRRLVAPRWLAGAPV